MKLLFSITAKDFNIDYFSGTGPGGQNRNKVKVCCRITHKDSNAVGISKELKSQVQNKKLAFKRCIESEKFKNWHKIEIARRLRQFEDIDKKVEEEMKKIKIEVYKDGKWIEK